LSCSYLRHPPIIQMHKLLTHSININAHIYTFMFFSYPPVSK
jgi:hypothetical protein